MKKIADILARVNKDRLSFNRNTVVVPYIMSSGRLIPLTFKRWPGEDFKLVTSGYNLSQPDYFENRFHLRQSQHVQHANGDIDLNITLEYRLPPEIEFIEIPINIII